jgi:tetratricopeptide (TPR) repeat protein
LKKFVRRHRVAFGTAFLVSVVVVLGLAGTTSGFLRARQAQVEAERHATSAEQTAEFLVGMFRAFDPTQAAGHTPTAREIVDFGAKRLDAERIADPRIQAELLDTIAVLYGKLGEYDEAATLLDRALEVESEGFGTDSLEYAELLGHRAEAIAGRSAFRGPVMEEAAASVRRMIEIRKGHLGDGYPDRLRDLASLAFYTRNAGHLDDALELSQQVVSLTPSDDPALPMFLHVLANTKLALAEGSGSRTGFGGEIELRERIVRLQRRSHGDSDPALCIFQSHLALAYERVGRYPEAQALLREALELRQRFYGPEHPDVFGQIRFNAFHLALMGNAEDALPLMRRFLEIRRDVESDDPDYVVLLAGYRAMTGDRNAALIELRRGVRLGYRSRTGAYDEGDLAESPYFVSLRGHPEFLAAANQARP